MNLFHRLKRKLRHLLSNEGNPRRILLERMPKDAVCAEVGVWKGEFSKDIVKFTRPRRFHLIDPWKFQSEFPNRMFGGSAAKSQDDMDRIYKDVQNRFGKLSNVSIHRGFSEEVLQDFDDDYFDWIYIDGNHYYEYVLKDLELAFRKVKRGGHITGDDYNWGEKEGFPVKRAVQELIERHGIAGGAEVFGGQFIIHKMMVNPDAN